MTTLTLYNIAVNNDFSRCGALAGYAQNIAHLSPQRFSRWITGSNVWKLMRPDVELLHELLSLFLRQQLMFWNELMLEDIVRSLLLTIFQTGNSLRREKVQPALNSSLLETFPTTTLTGANKV